ncbi:MAG: fatty acid desaturase family protein [Myxococcales bacterium]|nr:fatty acid desaturase family protein [Myxococcales bacterium]
MRKVTDYVSRDELRAFLAVDDRRGAWAVARTWGLIAAAFALAGAYPSVWTAALAILILGTQQHALAVVQHEATHGVLFRDGRWNDFVGRWLCGNAIWLDFDGYRRAHLLHHTKTGTADDPDYATLRAPYPRTRRSVARKLLRDAIGVTGVKRVVGLVLIAFGAVEFNTNGEFRWSARRDRPWREVLRGAWASLHGVALVQLTLFAVLAALGVPWLYGLWAIAYVIVFSVVFRIRAIGDHACTPDETDPFRNARTILVGPIERILFAPFNVTYHIGHHLVMTVPWYHLRDFHRVLEARGAVDPECVASGYAEVLRLATAAAEDPRPASAAAQAR